MMDKTKLRKKFADIRKSIARASVTDEIYASEFYRNAESVFSYVSYGTETDTIPFIERAIADNKRVAVPLMIKKGEMVFIKIDSLSALKPNKYGIPEPEYSNEGILVSDEGTLIAVPGIAFDKKGYRLGYGGGYYDRYLSANKYMTTAGFCYEQQITDSLPHNEYDVPVDIIVTERRIL